MVYSWENLATCGIDDPGFSVSTCTCVTVLKRSDEIILGRDAPGTGRVDKAESSVLANTAKSLAEDESSPEDGRDDDVATFVHVTYPSVLDDAKPSLSLCQGCYGQ